VFKDFAPVIELGSTPTVDETLACNAGMPRASMVGKVMKVPPPAMPFEMPAATPATANSVSRHPSARVAVIILTTLRMCQSRSHHVPIPRFGASVLYR